MTKGGKSDFFDTIAQAVTGDNPLAAFSWDAPMLSLLIVSLCSTLPGPPYCIEEMVAKLPYQVCTTQAQFTLAPWLASGKYAGNWRIEKFSCHPVRQEPDAGPKMRVE